MNQAGKKLKMRFVLTAVLAVLTAATVGYIWSNSMADGVKSSEQSSTVKEAIRPIVEPIVGNENYTDRLVRKMAHFTEFFVLGCELALGLVLTERVKIKWFVNITVMSLLTALIDETIQIFSGRGPMIQDVWLDSLGAVTGIIAVTAVYLIVKEVRRRRRTEG